MPCLLAAVAPAIAAAPDAPPSPPRHAPIPPDELDRAIRRTIERPEYAWRLPRERPPERERSGFWARVWDSIGNGVADAARAVARFVRKILRWFRDVFTSSPDPDSPPGEIGWQTPVQVLMMVLLLVTGSVLGVALYRLWRNRTRGAPGTAAAQPVAAAPDLSREDVVATDLPSDQWMKLAQELFRKGERRLGLRALFLGILAFLAHHERLTIARHKSNRDYAIELRRKAHDQPRILDAFARGVRSIERIWYGTDPATEALVESFRADVGVILEELNPRREPASSP